MATEGSMNALLKNGNEHEARQALSTLTSFHEAVKASPYFDAQDEELVRNTMNTFEKRLELTATLSDVIVQRETVLESHRSLGVHFREMVLQFAQKQVEMEAMRDAALKE